MNYYMIETTGDLNDESLCYIDEAPEDMGPKDVRLAVGRPAAKYFPQDARIRLHEEHPGIKLPGIIGNGQSFLIVSQIALATLSYIAATPFILFA